jgi:hypothetical protein
MNVATCEALAQLMPVLLIALIAERVAFKRTKNRRKARFKLASALIRTLFELMLALVIIGGELGFLNGIDEHGFKGETARSYWLLAVLVLIAILYRWVLLSPSVSYAFDRLFDLVFKWIGQSLQLFAGRFSPRSHRGQPSGE